MNTLTCQLRAVSFNQGDAPDRLPDFRTGPTGYTKAPPVHTSLIVELSFEALMGAEEARQISDFVRLLKSKGVACLSIPEAAPQSSMLRPAVAIAPRSEPVRMTPELRRTLDFLKEPPTRGRK